MGVDGFRLDAVPYLFEREGTNGENLPETHDFLKKLRRHIDEHFPDVVFLAEANMWPEEAASYFGEGDECHMNYHFPVMPRMFMSLQMEDRYPITDIFDQTPAIPDNCQWAIFLRNHDELTLEMVTDEERDYMYRTYAKDPKAKINLGIRHRLAPLMGNNRRKIELINSLLFSLPGTPVIYYGDEIGMGDNVYLGDRDGVRTPMQWSPDRNAGFSSANPHRLYLPTILDPEYHYESVNVETQRRNTSSLFWFMKRIIHLRKRHPAFGRGDMKVLPVENPKVLAFTRSCEQETLLIIINLSRFAQPTDIRLSGFEGYVPVELFSKRPFPAIPDNETYFFTLAAHDFQWFVLEKVQSESTDSLRLPTLRLDDRDDLLRSPVRERLETEILPGYLPRTDWFGQRREALQGISIIDHARLPLADGMAHLLLIEAHYERGLPDVFQLALAFADESLATRLSHSCPQAVLATVMIGQNTVLLCDGLYLPDIQQAIMQRLVDGPPQSVGRLRFQGSPVLDDIKARQSEIKPRRLSATTGSVTISYDDCLRLKMYRKVDVQINPDTELTRFLSEHAHFPHVPEFVGSIKLASGQHPVLLGVAERLIDRHGNGKDYVLERVDNYIERILARDRQQLETALSAPRGTLSQPIAFGELPAETQELLGRRAAEQARLLGIRIGEMHRALASDTSLSEFAPEPFSLHYQRSLYSGLQSLVREVFQAQERHLDQLPDDIRPEVAGLLARREDLLNLLKRIFRKKLDTTKIRIHGNLQLDNVVLTGRDVAFENFGGDPARNYSERRLKRSPLRDLATMIRSFYYVAYESFLENDQVTEGESLRLLPYAEFWAHYMSGFLIKAYLETVQGSSFIPGHPDELRMLLETFVLEKALQDVKYEAVQRPHWVRLPLHLVESILSEHASPAVKAEELQAAE